MPFYMHKIDEAPEAGVLFYTRQAAHEAKPAEDRTWAITFIASAAERDGWTLRELARLRAGEYLPVPWANDPIAVPAHVAHLSTSHKGMVAYTPDDAYGVADRQIRVKPGKYLTQFAPSLSLATIDGYILRCHAATADPVFKIAETAEDIRRVYEGGPCSCMGGNYWADSAYGGYGIRRGLPKFSGCAVHPAAVYAGPDLAVAYLENPNPCPDISTRDTISARAVIWPEKKIHSRVYGRQESTLRRILSAAGYAAGSLSGARINCIVSAEERRDAVVIVLPYVDGIDHAIGTDDPRYLMLRSGYRGRSGGVYPVYETGTTAGVATDAREPAHPDTQECGHCGEDFDYDADESFCEGCRDGRWTCDGCDEQFFDDDDRTTVTVQIARGYQQRGSFRSRDFTLCDSCHGDVETCEECSEEFAPQLMSSGLADECHSGLCLSCSRTRTACSDCGDLFDREEGESQCADCRPEAEAPVLCPDIMGWILTVAYRRRETWTIDTAPFVDSSIENILSQIVGGVR